jgi:hypothetical protein
MIKEITPRALSSARHNLRCLQTASSDSYSGSRHQLTFELLSPASAMLFSYFVVPRCNRGMDDSYEKGGLIMSKENIKLFYEALARDKSLQEKFKAVGQKYEGQKPGEAQTELIYQKELVPLAREAGYAFTLAELKEYAAATK